MLCVSPSSAPANNGPGAGDSLYVLKAFLTDPPSNPSWSYVATVTSTTPSSPFSGMTASGTARFDVTADHLQFVATTSANSGTVLDDWPAQSVDVSPGPECSASMGQDWQSATWIHWQFAKTDSSDLALLNPIPPAPPDVTPPPPPPLFQCISGSSNVQTSLVPGSFTVDTTANTMSWQLVSDVQLSCAATPLTDVTMTVTFSFRRL